jgi:disulfide bond formation protein DsbB
MDVTFVERLYGILGLVGIVAICWFAFMAIGARFSEGIAAGLHGVRARLAPAALWGGFVVALLAMVGSLYFSDVAHFQPCLLCWYQRIAMYPLVLLLGIAAIRRDVGVRIYAVPLALIGAAISTYHILVEWQVLPSSTACDPNNPCTIIWFREFGFISIATLALIAFALVIVWLLIPARTKDQVPDFD